ncbi:MAG: hypothetical protein M3Y80_08245 [Verrucomicrobiota bacterium]|nr:hypothetical protein [Verrucomicrobiota bacterium]
MSLARLFSKLKLAASDAEVIFDRDEPVGRPTDMVMARRRWFGAKKHDPRSQHEAPSQVGRPSASR